MTAPITGNGAEGGLANACLAASGAILASHGVRVKIGRASRKDGLAISAEIAIAITNYKVAIKSGPIMDNSSTAAADGKVRARIKGPIETIGVTTVEGITATQTAAAAIDGPEGRGRRRTAIVTISAA